MVTVCCPLCGGPLCRASGALRCPGGHSFDIARQGYVNLLPVTQKHSKAPGDTPEQVAARRAVFDSGLYEPVARRLAELCSELPCASVLDVGCGEGYYLAYLQEHLPVGEACGVDISKDAVRYASARNKKAAFFTATAAHLPFPDGSFTLLTAMFSLTMPEEYRRLLADDGCFVRVTAGRNHLMGLKRIIYPRIIEKESEPVNELPGFSMVRSERITFPIELKSNPEVMQLLKMTPHWLRITEEGLHRAMETDVLHDAAEVCFTVFRRLPG